MYTRRTHIGQKKCGCGWQRGLLLRCMQLRRLMSSIEQFSVVECSDLRGVLMSINSRRTEEGEQSLGRRADFGCGGGRRPI
jgi:hypothetical protein